MKAVTINSRLSLRAAGVAIPLTCPLTGIATSLSLLAMTIRCFLAVTKEGITNNCDYEGGI